MNIVIFGANGPTGRLLTEQALAEGHSVTAVTRHPDRFLLQHAQLRVMRGDVFNLSEVESAVAGQDAVLSTLGVPFSKQPIHVYSQGIGHILQAMNRSGVRRLVCVSSSATEPHADPQGGFFFEKLAENHIKGRFTSRADLANCMLRQLSSDRYVQKIAAVATVAVRPSMLKLIMREAFQSKHK